MIKREREREMGTGAGFFFALLFYYIKQLPIVNYKLYIINVLPPRKFYKTLVFLKYNYKLCGEN
jgi:hypothetical protein